ncbi:uncharacterized protein [Euphorbia lathyris]|uniref:uncharacterized protein isoform X3 n=1 Tax=Euphorbia lathyris TaxID=212925 RepID=UPI0033134D79
MPMLAEVLLAYLICGICCLINCSLLITNASLFRWNSIIGFNQGGRFNFRCGCVLEVYVNLLLNQFGWSVDGTWIRGNGI